MNEREVKSYKWGSLKQAPPKNAVIYVLDPETQSVEAYITDRFGNPVPLKSSRNSKIKISDYVEVNSNNDIIVNNNKLFVRKYVSGDDFIIIEESQNEYKIKLNDNKLELLSNKQDDLTYDGTGTKYPTIDAVNRGLQDIRDEIVIQGNDKNYVYEQITPSDEWVAYHNLNKKVTPIVTDSAGTVVEGQVIVNDGLKVIVKFNHPFTGYLICN